MVHLVTCLIEHVGQASNSTSTWRQTFIIAHVHLPLCEFVAYTTTYLYLLLPKEPMNIKGETY